MSRTLLLLRCALCACALWASASFADQYKLIHLNRYGKSPSLEFLVNSDQGSGAAEVFDVVSLPQRNFDLRLIYSPNSRNAELTSYYDVHYPDYFELTTTQSQQKRDMEMKVIASYFETAFKSTSTYDELSGLIEQRGYAVYRISHEKILVSESDVSAIDIYLHCVRVDKP